MSNLDLRAWDRLSSAEREELARQVSARDPRFTFCGLQLHSLAGQHHEIAHFRGLECELVLLPGAQALLGYDRDDPFRPSAAQQLSFDETEREFGITLVDYIGRTMTTPSLGAPGVVPRRGDSTGT